MRLAITHTKKVPGQEEYSSEGFGAEISVEVPDDQAQDAASVQGWLKELAEQCKQAVEQQLASVPRRNGNHQPASQASGLFNRPNNPPEQRQGNSQGVATPRQVSYLVSLASRQKITFADLQKIAQERFAAEDLYRLSKSQASELIDSLKPQASRR
jgi:antitoxin component of MazEF toxin-antitoxin module